MQRAAAHAAPPLLGRAPERERFTALRAGHRLVSITGPAGVGKSTFMRAVLEGEDTLVVDCAKATDPDELAAAVAEALGLSYRPLADREAIWTQAHAALSLRDSLVLVFDGIDRVRAQVAETVPGVLKAHDKVQVVLTGPEKLNVPKEAELALGGLDEDSAVALFERATGQIRPPLTDDERGDVRAIVRALTGHPLAITLCAARADVLRIQDLRERVEAALSASGEPGMPLAPAIGFSWELCDEGEQQALMDLSVFPGGFSIDGAEAVYTPTPAVGWAVDMIQGLKRKSVLVPYAPDPSSLRFRMPPPLWSYARSRLEQSGRAAAVHAKMAAYFARPDAPWTQSSQEGRRSLAHERENLLDVARHGADGTGRARAALALARLAHIHGPIRPLRDLVEDVRLTDGEDLEPDLAAELYAAEIELDQVCGDGGRAQDLLDHVPGPFAAHPAVGLARGMVLSLQGKTDEAATTLVEAKAGFAARRDKDREAAAAVRLAACAAIGGDLARAEGYTRRTISLTNDPWPIGRAWLNLGTARLDAGRVDAARYALDRAQEHYEQVGAPTGPVLVNLGLAALAQGDGDRAEPLMVQAADQAKGAGDARLFVYATCGLGVAALFRDRDDEARMLLGEAEVLANEEQDVLSATWAGAYLAVLDEKAGRSAEADERLSAAREAASHFSHPAPRAVVAVLTRAVAALRGESVEVPDELGPGAHVAAAQRYFHKATARAAETSDDRPALLIGEAGRQVVLPDGTNIDLSRRGPLRLILLALCEAHDKEPPTPLDVPQLIEAGWPGQRIVADAGPARVYAAIRTLRKLGFEEYLFTRDAGYLLAPDLQIVGTAG